MNYRISYKHDVYKVEANILLDRNYLDSREKRLKYLFRILGIVNYTAHGFTNTIHGDSLRKIQKNQRCFILVNKYYFSIYVFRGSKINSHS